MMDDHLRPGQQGGVRLRGSGWVIGIFYLFVAIVFSGWLVGGWWQNPRAVAPPPQHEHPAH